MDNLRDFVNYAVRLGLVDMPEDPLEDARADVMAALEKKAACGCHVSRRLLQRGVPQPGALQRPRTPWYEIKDRYAKCRTCHAHDVATGHCYLLGAPVGSNGQLNNELAYADARCPLHSWSVQRVRWVRTSELITQAQVLARLMPVDIARIVAIPRSGLLVGAVMATEMHLPLFAVQTDGSIIPVGGGWRMDHSMQRDGRAVLVDDTLHSGLTLDGRLDKAQLHDPFICVGFAAPDLVTKVHAYGQLLPQPHLLEWNLVNCAYVQHLALDMDGIICSNPTDDRLPGRVSRPLMLPRFRPPRAIITSRPESQRAVTEDWLHQWSCLYQQLIMWPGSEDERTVDSVAQWKAEQAIECGCDFYVESEPAVSDAMRAHHVRVLCPAQGGLW